MKIYLFLSLLIISTNIMSNSIVGNWNYDIERTIEGLKQQIVVPVKMLECYQKGLCGSNVSLRVTSDEFFWNMTKPRPSLLEGFPLQAPSKYILHDL